MMLGTTNIKSENDVAIQMFLIMDCHLYCKKTPPEHKSIKNTIFWVVTVYSWAQNEVSDKFRLRLKCDCTRAETRFRLSAKRTSPFKSAGASVQSTTGI